MIIQTEIVMALLAELDRQVPGVCVSALGMNAIIQAANTVCNAQREFTSPEQRWGTGAASDD